jgi:hypothetical protein
MVGGHAFHSTNTNDSNDGCPHFYIPSWIAGVHAFHTHTQAFISIHFHTETQTTQTMGVYAFHRSITDSGCPRFHSTFIPHSTLSFFITFIEFIEFIIPRIFSFYSCPEILKVNRGRKRENLAPATYTRLNHRLYYVGLRHGFS